MTIPSVPPLGDDARADAAMRALFASADRAPVGDEAFVQQIMGQVTSATARRGERAVMALGIVLVGLAATFAPHFAAGAGELGLAFVKNMPHLPALNTQVSGVVLALTLAGAGWLYAERG
jgi:hypothetical protein